MSESFNGQPEFDSDHTSLEADASQLEAARVRFDEVWEDSVADLREVEAFAARVPDAQLYPQYRYKLGEVTGAMRALGKIGEVLLQTGLPELDEQLKQLLNEE